MLEATPNSRPFYEIHTKLSHAVDLSTKVSTIQETFPQDGVSDYNKGDFLFYFNKVDLCELVRVAVCYETEKFE